MNNDKTVSLADLFHKRVFQVPDYQRGYSWEEQQVREFLEDLELLESGRFHYTGTVVLHESRSEESHSDPWMDEEGDEYGLAKIVDGQQRLTTIVLLLDGIRRSLRTRFSEKSINLSRGIKRNYLAASATSGHPLPKINLNEDTDHFFKEVILSDCPRGEEPKITSAQRLARAKEQIHAYIESKINTTPAEGEEWLWALYRKLNSQLRFTLYLIEDEAEAGVVFETMNDRGKPLSELEKVKNYLLHASAILQDPNAPNELAKSINRAWSEILRQLMEAHLESSADEDQLLRFDWLARYDPRPGEWNYSKSVKGKFALKHYKGRRETLIEDLHRYTEGLRESCVAYCDARQPNRSNAFDSFKSNPKDQAQVREWSSKLVRIRAVAVFLPLLLAVRKSGRDNPDKYLETLKLCEAFAFRVYRLAGRRTDAGQSRLFRFGHELMKGECEFPETMRNVKGELARLCGDDDFKWHTTYESPSNRFWRFGLLRYFLYEYESDAARKEGASPKLLWEELLGLPDTGEHILPQKISGRPYWEERFTHEEHEQYIHDLGNLTLTKHNASYGNKPFPDKKGEVGATEHCYAKSSLYIERELTHWEHWDAAAIDARRSRLLEWARKRWAVDLSGLSDEGHEPETFEDEFDEGAEFSSTGD